MVGYSPVEVSAKNDTIITVLLHPLQLEAVTVRASRPLEHRFGNVSIPIERLLAIPALAGERDIVRALTSLPGVVAGNEGQASLYVRGGGSDQNLFVLDGAYLYNTGHLFNFLSIFNPDAIQKVELYKGSFPAQYGGRLSSVVDVNMREGSKTKYQGKAEIGLITSKLLLEGPLIKNRSSFILTARGSYIDLFTIGQRRSFMQGDRESYLGFQLSDLSAKITHELSPRHKLYGSFYQSSDRYEVGNNLGSIDYSKYTLVNRLASVRYAGVIGNRLVLDASINHTLNRSTIDNRIIQNQPAFENNQAGIPVFVGYRPVDTTTTADFSSISDWVGRLQMGYAWNNHRLTAGVEAQQHRYLPYRFTNNDVTRQTESLRAAEYAAYVSNEFNWGQRVRVQTGLRWSGFQFGLAKFARLEPRVSLSVGTASLGTWSIGWGRTAQYQHALMRGADFLERQIWVPASITNPPQLSEQFSAGWQRSFTLQKQTYQISLEGYYRQMQQLSYYNTTDFGRYRYLNWPERLLSGGKGRTYGAEFLVTKTEGRLTGNLSYGLLWSERRFDALNNGQWFPFVFDRRHNLNLTGEYRLRPRWKLAAQFVYLSGRRFNFPTGRVVANPYTIGYEVYENYYQGKLPDTHRLDLALTNERKTAKGQSVTWTFSLYNVYARQNPFYVYVRRREVRQPDKPVEYYDEIQSVSLFPLIPGVSFAHSF
jgi:outer membrane receptor for ferrienterochelin and colicin